MPATLNTKMFKKSSRKLLNNEKSIYAAQETGQRKTKTKDKIRLPCVVRAAADICEPGD
jgi:hypothetical protein